MNFYTNYYYQLLGLFCLLSISLQAQQQDKRHFDEVLLFNVQYAFQTPDGDLKDRFGPSNAIGIGVDWVNNSNIIIGVSGHLQFGIEVKEDVLANLRDNEGDIIGIDQAIASVVLRHRGIYIGGHVGKIFPLSSGKRSGIRLTVGTGFFQHKIRVQDDLETVPQVGGDYQKGYDRLTNGLALTQFVGYQVLSPNRRINMYVGVEAMQAFTQNRRSYNFDTMQANTERRLDVQFALKVGWTVIPFFYKDDGSGVYY